MIVFYLKNHGMIKQYQLLDYIESPKILSQDYRKYNITNPLEYLEKKLQKWKNTSIIPQIPHFNFTLDKYINPHSFNSTIIIPDKSSQNAHSMRIAIEPPRTQEIKLDSFVNSDLHEPTQGSLLQNAVKSHYYLRFPSIPPAQYKNFCTDIIPKQRYIHYQEQIECKGFFTDMILLHPLLEYLYYEIDLRRKGRYPKGFSIQEIVYWEMFRMKSGIQNFSMFARIYEPIFKSGLRPNHLLMQTVPS